MLTIRQDRIGPDVVVLKITGQICLGRYCRDVEWHVEDLLKANERKVILDLSGVTHLDSTGVGIIVLCSGKLKTAGGELRVAGAKGTVEEILRMTLVDRIVSFYPTAAAAAEGFATAS